MWWLSGCHSPVLPLAQHRYLVTPAQPHARQQSCLRQDGQACRLHFIPPHLYDIYLHLTKSHAPVLSDCPHLLLPHDHSTSVNPRGLHVLVYPDLPSLAELTSLTTIQKLGCLQDIALALNWVHEYGRFSHGAISPFSIFY